MRAMLGTVDTATRLLQLLSLLNARPVWSGDDLAERLGVTPRTVRRDIARLRDLDYPVEAVSGPHGGYRMGRGNEVPPLALDDQEALATLLGLRLATTTADGLEGAAASALAKLERVLPDRLVEHLRSLRDATIADTGFVPAVTDPDQLLVLAQACRQSQRVRFFYAAYDGAKSLRHVDPYRLVFVARRWYLVAFDLDRDDWRTFRVDRLRSSLPTGIPATQRPDPPDPLELVNRGRRVAAYAVQATVRLHVPIERARQLVPSWVGVMEPDGTEATTWSVGAPDVESLASWLATTACRIEVLDPPEVAHALDEHLRRLTGATSSTSRTASVRNRP